ncbi:hypothetical protein L596_013892 [Steinernema carpocapsae]|uniref:TIL domain-containing protein n=1 Tax=Steinernema carpocapsae TaxID=34508 RepID=A0A4U5P2L7_STECR|nr:hypothetical protein L596_013892 [Steinernema carpocapsae]
MASTVQISLFLAISLSCALAVSTNSTQCGDNEAYKPCSRCEETCHEPNPTCTAACGPPKCQCVVGFVRNDQGMCVSIQSCGNQTCSDNETWKKCGECEPTCAELDPDCSDKLCLHGKCVCKPGTYRNSKGLCVDLRQCSAENDACASFVCLDGKVCVNYRRKCQKPPCFVEPKCINHRCLKN